MFQTGREARLSQVCAWEKQTVEPDGVGVLELVSAALGTKFVQI